MAKCSGVESALRIVIADDDPDTVRTLAAILQDEGHEIYGFGTGREALAAARLYSADAMIVDIQMPDMTGYDIARQARAHLAKTPLLIAVSGRWKGETETGRSGPYAPDIDDGVKVNIRPFQELGLLAMKEVIMKW